MKIRIISIFFAVIMVVPLLSVTAFAAEPTAVRSFNELKDNICNGAILKLVGDIDETGALVIPSGCSVTIDLNGHFINRWLTGYGSDVNIQNDDHGSVFEVSGELTLINTDPDAVHYFTRDAGGLWVMAESGTPLKGGVITGGTGLQYGGKYYGGGIDVKSNGARLYIGEGVNIVGNTADEGGGIYVEQNSANNDVDDSAIGAVIMNGGSLVGNTAVTGGGVRVNKHSFIEMNDGSLIYDNTAASDGGGVYVFEGWSSLTMNPGSVIDGNSGASGGGIYSDGGSVLINGGKVINNKAAKDYGAAINTKDNQYCSLRIIDGVITGNRANVSCALTVNNPLEIGGKTVIENNFGGNGEPSDLYLGSYTVNKTATPVTVQYAGAPGTGCISALWQVLMQTLRSWKAARRKQTKSISLQIRMTAI